MLITTADYGDHESVRDCLATLADRLENLEVVVYASEANGDAWTRESKRRLKSAITLYGPAGAAAHVSGPFVDWAVELANDSTDREQSRDTQSVSRLEKIGLLAVAANTAKQELYNTVIPECSKPYSKDQVFPCRCRLHSNVHQTDDVLALAIEELSALNVT
jgi:hypothetical protein